ncbi:MAG: hypothetical protein MK008_14270 [Bdellovibrionales bacterium]|nr:hypothetical protein [Bdellovibrionales bacterium]
MKAILIVLSLFVSINLLAEIKVVKGVIRESTCNSPSGLGYFTLEQRVDNNFIMKGIKVNSKKLCGSDPGQFTYLSSIGYDALFLGETKLFEVIIEDGFAVDAEMIEDIDYLKFKKNVKYYDYQNSLKESSLWFHNGPAGIDFYYSEEKINELITKYTRQD